MQNLFCNFAIFQKLRLSTIDRVGVGATSSATLLAGTPGERHYTKPSATHAIFRELGSVSFNEMRGDGSREVKTLNVDVNALYLRVLLEENYTHRENPGDQVGIIAIKVIGYPKRGDIRNENTSYAVAAYDDSSGEEDEITDALIKRVKERVAKLEEFDNARNGSARPASKRADGYRSRPVRSHSSYRPSSTDKRQRSTSSRPRSRRPSSSQRADSARPVTSRTKAKVVRDILDAPWSDEDEKYGSSKNKSKKNQKTPAYFRTKLGEFNNIMRILEVKKSESIMNENYLATEQIAELLERMKTSEEEMVDWLEKRKEAIDDKDFKLAHECKSEFEKTRDNALSWKEIDKHVTSEERKQLRYNTLDDSKQAKK
uniref:Centrosomal protein CEP104 N-terminal domain-containing protein n=1 Tax=Plectus sambesii TaxID=2011161 RepID=A0A914X426_9BILA